MTNKLYYSNQYLQEWDTKITQVVQKNNQYYIELDQTAFYPEGGGQPSDKGYIDNLEIIDVVEIDNTVFHVLSQKPQNTAVHCRLDFQRRFDFMQQHSGQHLLSSVFYSLYGAHTNSFHLGENYVSIDLSIADITSEMISKTERQINEYIFKNLPIRNYIVTKDECNSLPLRKFPKVDEDIRIIEIDKTDYSPCCGTHVSHTGEIGLIKIVKVEKNKGMTRIYFKCGMRALVDFQDKHSIIQNLMYKLSTSENEIINKIDSDNTALRNSLKEIKNLKEIISDYEAKDILKNSSSKLIIKNFDDKCFSDIQLIAEQLVKKAEVLFIAASLTEKKLIAYNSLNDTINLNSVFKENLSKFSAKGGGSDKKAQASFESESQIIEFEKLLNEIIKF